MRYYPIKGLLSQENEVSELITKQVLSLSYFFVFLV